LTLKKSGEKKQKRVAEKRIEEGRRKRKRDHESNWK